MSMNNNASKDLTKRPDPAEDIASAVFREWLIDTSREDVLTEFSFWSNKYGAAEHLTEAALATSLCPLHLIDYAICFDDDDLECDQIRAIHPNHDT